MFDGDGHIRFIEDLKSRAHDIAVAPDGRTAIVFARRPGWFALVIDLAVGKARQSIAAIENRHFCGHGFFSADGKLLYATENAFDIETGVIGVYDVAAGYVRIGEFESGGVGPHQALLMPGGETIAVANGGILTHPDYGRRKLNLPTMEPSLTYLDRRSGEQIETHRLSRDLNQLSIRHMAVDQSGSVWFGCQYEGPATDTVPLIGRHRRGREAALVKIPDKTTRAFRNYIGSVAANRSGTRIGVTSPRGGVLAIFDISSQEIVATHRHPDICGLAANSENGFTATSGAGRILGEKSTETDFAWDNHLRPIKQRRTR